MRYFLILFSTFAFAQQTQSIDFKTIHAAIEIDPAKRYLVGKGTYTFEVKNKIDTIRIDARSMGFTNVKINDQGVKFIETETQLLLYKGFSKGENILTFDYQALPAKSMYFVNWDFSEQFIKLEKLQGQVWTQGQGQETSHWLPSFDDPNEKAVFSLDITFPKGFNVVSNGILSNKNNLVDKVEWQYRMIQPMSSNLVTVAVGHYNEEVIKSASNIPIHLYYEKEDSLRFEPTYRFSKEIFDELESEIGIPYPWGVYYQVPVRDFIRDGMGNTTATLFSRNFVVDSIGFQDQNYVSINARELAQQWFGDFVTPKSGKDLWLQEGFKTYYGLLAEKKIFGDNYFYFKLYNLSQEVKEAAKNDAIPILNEKASSLTLAAKGALALYFIQESIGVEKFKIAVRNYLESHAYKNASTEDFLNAIHEVSAFDTNSFQKKWLEQSQYPESEIDKFLQKNYFMKEYFKMQESPLSLDKDREKILEINKNFVVYYPIKTLLLYQSVLLPFEKKEYLLLAALQSGDLYVRQAVAATLLDIPESFRLDYEALLFDKSYKTQEIALVNLWKQFPEHRVRYIDLSKNWVGFQDKNLKLEHLFLAYLTAQNQNEKFPVYRELLSYTENNYDSVIRQNALEKLLALDSHTEPVFLALIYGTCSHSKQFNKFSKDTIRQLLKDEDNKQLFIKIRGDLPNREKTQLQKLLSEL